MKEMKCRVRDCKNVHKSPSGYCSEHGDRQTKHVVREADRPLTVDGPRLAEERGFRRDNE